MVAARKVTAPETAWQQREEEEGMPRTFPSSSACISEQSHSRNWSGWGCQSLPPPPRGELLVSDICSRGRGVRLFRPRVGRCLKLAPHQYHVWGLCLRNLNNLEKFNWFYACKFSKVMELMWGKWRKNSHKFIEISGKGMSKRLLTTFPRCLSNTFFRETVGG